MILSERIKEVVKHSGLSIPKFADYVGFTTPQTVRELVNGRTKSLSFAVASKILATYPEISEVWLKEGVGDMIAPSKSTPQARSVHDVTNGAMVTQGDQSQILKIEIEKELVEDFDIDDNAVCKKHYKKLKALLEKANREIARLEGKVEEQDKFIKLLLDRK